MIICKINVLIKNIIKMSVHCMDGYLFNKAKNQFGNIKLFTLKKKHHSRWKRENPGNWDKKDYNCINDKTVR